MTGFVKAHACGNDFLVMDEAAAAGRHAEMAKRLCARNTGVGADGIEFLDRASAKRPEGGYFLRLFNADGSEAELSGNGTRCVAAWLAMSEGLNEVALGTHGGVRRCRVISREGNVFQIESGMGVPRVMARRVEIEGVGVVEGAMVNVGNPHFVLFTEAEDFSSYGMSWQALGAKIAVSQAFRFGTNVEFVRGAREGAGEIAFRIFERGCGPTTSSGTGTCASATAAMVLRGAARELTAVAEGGAQRVVWAEGGAEMMLTGPAEIVCRGEVFGGVDSDSRTGPGESGAGPSTATLRAFAQDDRELGFVAGCAAGPSAAQRDARCFAQDDKISIDADASTALRFAQDDRRLREDQ